MPPRIVLFIFYAGLFGGPIFFLVSIIVELAP